MEGELMATPQPPNLSNLGQLADALAAFGSATRSVAAAMTEAGAAAAGVIDRGSRGDPDARALLLALGWTHAPDGELQPPG